MVVIAPCDITRGRFFCFLPRTVTDLSFYFWTLLTRSQQTAAVFTEFICQSGWDQKRQRLALSSLQRHFGRAETSNPSTRTEAVVLFRTGPRSHTDSAKEKPLLDSAKKKKHPTLGAPGCESSHAWHFVRFFFFRPSFPQSMHHQASSRRTKVDHLKPYRLIWTLLLRFQRLRSHCASALRLPRSLGRPSLRLPALMVALSNRLMFVSLSGRLMDVTGNVAEYCGAPT